MNRQIKEKVEQSKTFVKKHQTAIACTTTAIVTAKLTHAHTMRSVTRFVYEAGMEYGKMSSACSDALNFIARKDLADEFLETTPRLAKLL